MQSTLASLHTAHMESTTIPSRFGNKFPGHPAINVTEDTPQDPIEEGSEEVRAFHGDSTGGIHQILDAVDSDIHSVPRGSPF